MRKLRAWIWCSTTSAVTTCEHDVDLEGFHGEDPISQMRAIFPDLRQVRMIPGAGHRVQLEASDEVNATLLDYLLDIWQH